MAGHYSSYTEHNGTIYISGQLPINPDNNQIPENIEEQTNIVLQKLDSILHQSGSSKENVVQVRIYITDVNYWDIVNRIYAEYFGEHKPSRCIVPVPALHFGCKIELEAVSGKKHHKINN